MLTLLHFITTHPDWEQLLLAHPYRIRMKRENGYIILCYRSRSDYNIDLVRECRGIILDETDNYRPVCVPFFKFSDYGEAAPNPIDWKTARVQEKIDGSLIKVWWDKGEWHVSTNKMINAASARFNDSKESFLDFFHKAWKKTGVNFNDLNRDYTYMFELVSPKVRIVVPYKQMNIYHIGTRDNKTLKELDLDIGVKKPREFAITSIETCIEAAKRLGKKQEGFVVVDSQWHRIKVKSPEYIKIHEKIQKTLHYSNPDEVAKDDPQTT